MEEEKMTCEMFMTKYQIDNVFFKFTNPDGRSEGRLLLDNVFSKRIKPVADNEFEYDLICNIHDENDTKLPYEFSAEIKGWFRLENWQSEANSEYREVAPATVLFPLLRAYAVNITSNANAIPPLVLGLVNAQCWKTIKSV